MRKVRVSPQTNFIYELRCKKLIMDYQIISSSIIKELFNITKENIYKY